MRKLIVCVALLCAVADGRAQDVKGEAAWFDSVVVRSSSTIKGLLRTDGTNLNISATSGIRFDSEVSFNSAVQFNLSNFTEAQKTALSVGASERPIIYVSDPVNTAQTLQFKTGSLNTWRAPLHVAVGTDPTDGSMILWRADSVATLAPGAANTVLAMNAAGTFPNYTAATITSAGSAVLLDVTAQQGNFTVGGVRVGEAGVTDGEITLFADNNAFSVKIKPPAAGYSANKTLYYQDFTQNTDTIGTREWVRSYNSSLPVVLDFTSKQFIFPNGATGVQPAGSVAKTFFDTSDDVLRLYTAGDGWVDVLTEANAIAVGPLQTMAGMFSINSDSIRSFSYVQWDEADTVWQLSAGNSHGAEMELFENSDNGTQKFTIRADESIATNQIARTSDLTYQSIVFHQPTAASTWTDKAAGLAEFLGATNVYVTRMSLSGYLQWRIVANVSTGGGVSGSKIGAQFSTNGTTWRGLDNGTAGVISTVTLTDETTGHIISSWAELAGTARVADIYLRIVGQDGNSTGDPAFTMVRLELK